MAQSEAGSERATVGGEGVILPMDRERHLWACGPGQYPFNADCVALCLIEALCYGPHSLQRDTRT